MNSMNKTIFVCVPTYREPKKVIDFLKSCEQIRYAPFKLIIVNANPGDETSKIIQREKYLVNYEIFEIDGQSDEFWSATVNRGLKFILNYANPEDWILLSNIDIKFNCDIVGSLFEQASQKHKVQVGAACVSSNNLISSGVQVKSWFTTLTKHPYAGYRIDDIPQDLLLKVDYLPTRCMIFPVEAITEVGLIADKYLPHYGADYEFSHRLAKAGYTPFIYFGASIEVDKKNTGKSIYSNQSTFSQRLSNLMDIKNPSNPKFRLVFIILVYPLYAIPTAIIAYFIRTLVEISLEKKQISSIFGSQERGFSE
ncbi:MAG: hypothetical protein Kow0091_18700 [Geminocystis sp.]